MELVFIKSQRQLATELIVLSVGLMDVDIYKVLLGHEVKVDCF